MSPAPEFAPSGTGAAPAECHGLGDRLILLTATGLGAGRLPHSPGTYGSVWGLLLAAGLELLKSTPEVYGIALAALLLLGVPICGRAARCLGLKDPGPVVYDEYASLPLAYLGVSFSWTTAIAGFAIFRVLDITKPWPLRRLERLPGGWGIMADDVGAAGLTGLLLWCGHAFLRL